VRRTWSRIFPGQSSNLSLLSFVVLLHRQLTEKPSEYEKEEQTEIRNPLALTAQVMRLTFVAADFAR
jgi:hypothetical protein